MSRKLKITIMKKYLIIAVASCFFFFGCSKNDTTPVSMASTNARQASPSLTCSTYSIYNPHGPTGITITYEYDDCSGVHQTGGVIDPLQTVTIVAQTGSVICAGGVITLVK
jgi:hypothetical protein